MARYFKLVEIDQDSFIEAVGEDLNCCQMYGLHDGIIYVAIEDPEGELNIDLYDFPDDEDTSE